MAEEATTFGDVGLLDGAFTPALLVGPSKLSSSNVRDHSSSARQLVAIMNDGGSEGAPA
jgi:hypothetical protein